MNDHTTPSERGLALEQRIERLFRARGYDVVHDVWLTGRSGTRHQIDVLATYEAPLHRSTIVVETKAYDGSVDKDRVMKLIHIVGDLGADRGIIITTSTFTPDAIRIAQGYNVDLWDRERLRTAVGESEIASLSQIAATPGYAGVNTVAPLVDGAALRADIGRQLAKRARGTLGIGRVIETLVSFDAMSFPYYEANLEVEVVESQRVGLLRKEQITTLTPATVSFNACTGAPVEASADGIVHDLEWMAGLTRDEIAILQSTALRGATALQDLISTGLTDTRLKRAIGSLVEKGSVMRLDTRPASYEAVHQIPETPLVLRSISAECEVLADGASPFSPARLPVIEPGTLVRVIESYWPGATVRSVRMLRYPYYCAMYRRADGSIRSEAINAVTGMLDEVVAKSMKMPAITATG